MAYNTKNIIRDASGAPIPQLFNPAADEYQPLEGTGGAHKTQLSGSTMSQLTLDSSAIGVSSYESGVIAITLGWGTGRVEGSSDGTLYRVIPVKSVDTGVTFRRIDNRGRYFVDLRGISHLCYIASHTIGGTGAHTAVISLLPKFDNPLVNVIRAGVKYSPTPITGDFATTTSGRTVMDVQTSTGTLYAIAGPNISKSVDYGASWVNVIDSARPWNTTSFNNGKIAKLRSGKVLAVLANVSGDTKIYLSDTAEANFAEVYSFAQQGIVSSGFGFSVYGDIILFAPYKLPRADDDTLQLHMSTNGGATWAVAHTAPATATWHYHDVVFDPYRKRIWLAVGDDYARANVLYSDDWGANWQTLWTGGDAPTQFTSIHPMPNCVLFGSDQTGKQGVYKWYAQDADKGTAATHVLEPVYMYSAPGVGGQATYRAGGQFWDSGAVYFSSKLPAVIFATKDGETFHNVYQHPNSATTILGIWVESAGGKLVAFGAITEARLLVATAPVWSVS